MHLRRTVLHTQTTFEEGSNIVTTPTKLIAALAFNNCKGVGGLPIMIPLIDKDDLGRRSHYQTIHTSIPDAPSPDEIVVALGASIGGHPYHRFGDRC